jgi:hypothetical protein
MSVLDTPIFHLGWFLHVDQPTSSHDNYFGEPIASHYVRSGRSRYLRRIVAVYNFPSKAYTWEGKFSSVQHDEDDCFFENFRKRELNTNSHFACRLCNRNVGDLKFIRTAYDVVKSKSHTE